jgi:cation diffusion facilitator family transporter
MKSAVGDTSAADRIWFVGWIGLFTNLALAAIKMTAGTLGHSHAVVADAIHSLSDVATDVALLAGVRFWAKPADERHPHGHQRIETLVTVLIGASLAAVALGLMWDAIVGGHSQGSLTPTPVAFAAAVLSIAVKEVLFRWTLAEGRRVDSPALVANAWHHRSDSLSSIPAAAAVAVAVVVPGFAFVDRIGALVVCVFILLAAKRILTPALSQLIDTGAPREDRRNIRQIALGVEGVQDAHAIRTRYVGPNLAVDLHIVVDAELSVEEGHAIGERVQQRLLDNGPKVADVLVHVEPHGEDKHS